MKPIFTILLFFLCYTSLFSQAPEEISYQAVIRNNDNTLASDTPVTLKIRIYQNSVSGEPTYEEDHSPRTNANGLVSIKIGDGVVVRGDFSAINWADGPYFVETLVDVNGGSSFNLVGSSELLSVPYALHAKTAERIVKPYRAQVIELGSSRAIIASDVNNTIACTSSATYTLSTNFADMEVGDTINLEAHNGAVLTVTASTGVTLNYNAGGSALFESEAGNVRFGLLRKSDDNAFIISGQ
ncbi:hypothetical protein MHTCC0001_29180 [Flavobacteriaceae bacterium MHTCC 0001]